MDRQTLEVLGATAEVMGVQLSDPALEMMAEDLAEYPPHKIRAALRRLRQESGKFSISEIIKRMPGTWPTPEIAWATAPRDEAQSFVTTREALAAWNLASQQDTISGRMAFKEAYEQFVSESKAQGKSPEWIVSLGHDKALRDQVILDAVLNGILMPTKAAAHLPHIPIADIERLAEGTTSTHALQELHQATISSVAQLVAPEEIVASTATAKAHIAGIMSVLRMATDKEPETPVQANIASLKRLHE